jgi:hypothetical protein
VECGAPFQVGRCVDNADVLILNNEQIAAEVKRAAELRPKVLKYSEIVEGMSATYPEVDEILDEPSLRCLPCDQMP